MIRLIVTLFFSLAFSASAYYYLPADTYSVGGPNGYFQNSSALIDSIKLHNSYNNHGGNWVFELSDTIHNFDSLTLTEAYYMEFKSANGDSSLCNINMSYWNVKNSIVKFKNLSIDYHSHLPIRLNNSHGSGVQTGWYEFYNVAFKATANPSSIFLLFGYDTGVFLNCWNSSFEGGNYFAECNGTPIVDLIGNHIKNQKWGFMHAYSVDGPIVKMINNTFESDSILSNKILFDFGHMNLFSSVLFKRNKVLTNRALHIMDYMVTPGLHKQFSNNYFRIKHADSAFKAFEFMFLDHDTLSVDFHNNTIVVDSAHSICQTFSMQQYYGYIYSNLYSINHYNNIFESNCAWKHGPLDTAIVSLVDNNNYSPHLMNYSHSLMVGNDSSSLQVPSYFHPTTNAPQNPALANSGFFITIDTIDLQGTVHDPIPDRGCLNFTPNASPVISPFIQDTLYFPCNSDSTFSLHLSNLSTTGLSGNVTLIQNGTQLASYFLSDTNSTALDTVITFQIIPQNQTSNNFVIVYDSMGIFNQGIAQQTVLHFGPLQQISFDTLSCNGNSLELDYSHLGIVSWLDQYPHTIRVVNPSIQNLSLSYSAAHNCGSDIMHLSIGYTAMPSLLADNYEFCSNDSITIFAPNSYTHYLWNNQDTSYQKNIKTPGQYILKVMDSAGCNLTDTAIVFENTPYFTDWETTTICPEDSMGIHLTQFDSLFWNNGTSDTLLYVLPDNSYTVHYLDSNNCWFAHNYTVNKYSSLSSYNTFFTICSYDSLNLNYATIADSILSIGTQQSFEFDLPPDSIYSIEYIDTNSCYRIDTVSVAVHPIASLDTHSVNLCYKDTLVVNATNSTVTLWNSFSQSNQAQLYSDTILTVEMQNSAGCQYYDTIDAIMHPVHQTNWPEDTTVCVGLELIAGPPSFDYLWNNGNTSNSNQIDSTYWISVLTTDSNNCTLEHELFVEIVDPLVPDYTIQQNGWTITCTSNNNNADSWSWNFGNGSTSFVQNTSYTYTSNNTYPVVYTTSNLCGTVSDTTLLDIYNSTTEVKIPKGSVYPNPIHDHLVLSEFPKNSNYTITTATGQILRMGVIQTNRDVLYLESFATGVYFLTIEMNQKPQTFKFIVEK